MGQIDRLKRITKARIQAFLDSLESPEIIFPQLIKELAAKVKEAGNAEAKALSAVKADQRRLDEANGMVLRFSKGAQLAVQAGDNGTAKQAISAQIKAEQKAAVCEKSIEISESAYATAKQVRLQLQDSLNELKVRKKDILNRSKKAKLQKQAIDMSSSDNDLSPKSIMDAVARMEAKVELAESHIQVQSEISKTLGSAFGVENIEHLEDKAEVQKRLEKLKDRINS